MHHSCSGHEYFGQSHIRVVCIVTWCYAFCLQELLARRLGVYSHVINVHPNYPVKDLLVELTIHETRDISELRVKTVPGGEVFRSAGTLLSSIVWSLMFCWMFYWYMREVPSSFNIMTRYRAFWNIVIVPESMIQWCVLDDWS